MAEGILRSKIKENNLSWQVGSAGTASYHSGDAPDLRAQKELIKHAIDISKQRARKFTAYFFEEYDLIFAMDSMNYSDVIRQANSEDEKKKVSLIMNLTEPGKNTSVPDPYYDDALYPVVYKMLDSACNELIRKYMKE